MFLGCLTSEKCERERVGERDRDELGEYDQFIRQTDGHIL